MLHFFTECEVAKDLSRAVEKYAIDEFKVQGTINPKNLILGEVNPDQSNILNTIVLATKCKMYSMRCLGKIATLTNIKHFISECKNFERYNAIKKQKLNIHLKKWNEINLDEYIINDMTEPRPPKDG